MIKWEATPGLRFGPLLHPAPTLLKVAGITSYVHAGEHSRDSQHCEFAAVSKETGKKYWIEAKMRSVSGLLGKNDTDGTPPGTARNPISHLIPHLHAALRKPAADERMVFIDLNAAMPNDASEENRPEFINAVNRRLKRYEREQTERGKSAYVFVTNMTAHRELMEPAQLLVIPASVGISDFNRTGHFSLSELYRRDQKHSDALAVGESLSKLLSFPTTFDGSLPGISLNGDKPPIQIGQK